MAGEVVDIQFVVPTAVWKFPMKVTDLQPLRLPKGAVVLSVGCQGESLNLWAQVDPTETEHEDRIFEVRGTGHELPVVAPSEMRREFIGTTMMLDGALVWHVFELVRV